MFEVKQLVSYSRQLGNICKWLVQFFPNALLSIFTVGKEQIKLRSGVIRNKQVLKLFKITSVEEQLSRYLPATQWRN